MSYVRRFIKQIVNRLLGLYGYEIVPGHTRQRSYIPATETIKAAQSQGQSVCEYVEELWGQQGETERVVQAMLQAGCCESANHICEIGPGTGRYLELTIRSCSPNHYDIYEIADDWAEYLAHTYAPTVVRQLADGRTLSATSTESCGLVHAHGVFACL